MVWAYCSAGHKDLQERQTRCLVTKNLIVAEQFEKRSWAHNVTVGVFGSGDGNKQWHNVLVIMGGEQSRQT